MLRGSGPRKGKKTKKKKKNYAQSPDFSAGDCTGGIIEEVHPARSAEVCSNDQPGKKKKNKLQATEINCPNLVCYRQLHQILKLIFKYILKEKLASGRSLIHLS